MRKLFSSLILFFVAASAFSQTASIKGFVIDSVDKKNLNNTAITLLQKSDSTLVKFTRAGKEGSFLLSGLKGGSYILMNTHPYMGDYFNNIELKNDEALDLGNIFMTPKSKLLAEVILKSGTPIRIKGDTTIYTADSSITFNFNWRSASNNYFGQQFAFGCHKNISQIQRLVIFEFYIIKVVAHIRMGIH